MLNSFTRNIDFFWDSLLLTRLGRHRTRTCALAPFMTHMTEVRILEMQTLIFSSQQLSPAKAKGLLLPDGVADLPGSGGCFYRRHFNAYRQGRRRTPKCVRPCRISPISTTPCAAFTAPSAYRPLPVPRLGTRWKPLRLAAQAGKDESRCSYGHDHLPVRHGH